MRAGLAAPYFVVRSSTRTVVWRVIWAHVPLHRHGVTLGVCRCGDVAVGILLVVPVSEKIIKQN